MSRQYHLDDAAFHSIVGADRLIYRPISYIKNLQEFQNNPLGWILHVTEGNGSPFNTFNRNIPGERKFSNLFVAKDGKIEQYAPLRFEPWAQVNGNPFYFAVETEGFADQALTYAQQDSLARIHWAFVVLLQDNRIDRIANSPGEYGIGTHSMGGAAWGGHACPGSLRASQRGEILERKRLLSLK